MTFQKKYVVLVALFTFLFMRSAGAVYYTAQELAATCLKDSSSDIQACTHYVAGVIDYHQLLQSLNVTGVMDFCLPDSITKQQAAVLVMAYLRDAPQHDAFVAAAAIPLALNKAFPCPVNKKKK